MSVQDIMTRTGPRKLLALGGGGIRGLITVEVLAAVEAQLQRDRGDDFVLADAFDYVAGTSTGAVIATCVARGMRVAEIRDFYRSSFGDCRHGDVLDREVGTLIGARDRCSRNCSATSATTRSSRASGFPATVSTTSNHGTSSGSTPRRTWTSWPRWAVCRRPSHTRPFRGLLARHGPRLPTPPEVFREQSVEAGWRRRFDHALNQIRERGTLRSLALEDGSEAYLRANAAFLDRATELATDGQCAVALVIAAVGEGQIVEDLVASAYRRRLPVLRVDPH